MGKEPLERAANGRPYGITEGQVLKMKAIRPPGMRIVDKQTGAYAGVFDINGRICADEEYVKKRLGFVRYNTYGGNPKENIGKCKTVQKGSDLV